MIPPNLGNRSSCDTSEKIDPRFVTKGPASTYISPSLNAIRASGRLPPIVPFGPADGQFVSSPMSHEKDKSLLISKIISMVESATCELCNSDAHEQLPPEP